MAANGVTGLPKYPATVSTKAGGLKSIANNRMERIRATNGALNIFLIFCDILSFFKFPSLMILGAHIPQKTDELAI